MSLNVLIKADVIENLSYPIVDNTECPKNITSEISSNLEDLEKKYIRKII